MGPFQLTSHGTESAMLKSKLHAGTSKTKRLHPVKLEFSLFWMSQCVASSPAWWILYHVTVSCKGPIAGPSYTICRTISFSVGVTRLKIGVIKQICSSTAKDLYKSGRYSFVYSFSFSGKLGRIRLINRCLQISLCTV